MPVSIPVTSALGSSGYTYALDSDLDIRWGKTNVDKWADANNNGNAAEILARRGWALARAERYINSRLKGTLYTIPFDATPSTPLEITDLVVTFAGIYLYQSPRGLVDGEDTLEAMQREKDDAEMMLRNIIGGIIRISATTTLGHHPEAVPVTSIATQLPIMGQ